MAISFSRPDPSSPSAVAAATFPTARRGFDQGEVRDLLRMVAAELGRLQERERFLERELRAAQHTTTSAAVALDEEAVTRMLGEEAARILHTARDSAQQIKGRAEEGAARLIREASEEANRLREEAEVESARRRADAATDAEAELAMAKQQGREMVEEARSYRERVLGELSRRRELARQQIDQLVHGRDRLLQAFERARLAATDVLAEVTPLGPPSELVNLAATTGPLPVMLPTGRVDPPPADLPLDVPLDLPETSAPVAAVDVTDVVDQVEKVPHVTEVADAVVVDEVADEPADPPLATVVSLFAGEPDVAPSSSVEEADGPADVATAVGADDADRAETAPEVSPVGHSAGELFARLRAARLSEVARRASAPPATVADGEPPVTDARTSQTPHPATSLPAPSDATVALARPAGEVDDRPAGGAPADSFAEDTPFSRRDAELTPVIVALARKVKRVLADEQNDVLHALRRAKGPMSFGELIPGEAEQLERYVAAMRADLERAAEAGAASLDPDALPAQRRAAVNRADAVAPAVAAFDHGLVAPLRERLERAVSSAAGDHEDLAAHVRSIYREWKSQRIDEYLDDVARTAYGRGQLAALVPGTPVCWAVDPGGPECADAEDNSLAGAVPAGDPFPTEHPCTPAHPGCRCLLVPAPR